MDECTHRGDNLTVYRGKSEVIVNGSGSDWQVQYSQIPGCPDDGWWFSNRQDAEVYAQALVTEPLSYRQRPGCLIKTE